MLSSKPRLNRQFRLILGTPLHLRAATLVLLGIVGFFGAIALSWLLGVCSISQFFLLLHAWQQNPPQWLEPPNFRHPYYLLMPTAILLVASQGVMKLSPQPKTWSRVVVVLALLALTLRYLLWRSLSTLNLANPLDGVFSLLLFFMELLVLGSGVLQLYLLLGFKDRRQEADRYAVAVEQEAYAPSVDILIPTYNEPDFILRRSIIGCQALDYQNKIIYLLDDRQRPEIRELAQGLDCHYVTRPDNRYAKAGNLNHALSQTSGELVVVFDADFVPTANFLKRTVGFFQNEKIAMVQTPQSFYNSDPIAKNLGLEKVLTPEEEVFYRQIQPSKDGAGSVVCAGTSFVVRRSVLKEVGYFVTDSLCEDYFTGIRLSAKGYQGIYLNEKLSAGLAAESIAAHVAQRLRWVRGTLQAFFIDSNPLTIRGLGLRQRLGHLEGLLHWFTSIPRLIFLTMPLAYAFLGINPILVSPSEVIYFFLPYYLTQLTVSAWLNGRSRSALLSDIYALVLCVPLAITVVRVMLNPFIQGFGVTPKGIARSEYYFNWKLAFPLLILLSATATSLWLNLSPSFSANTINLGLVWSIYNLVMLSVALLTLLDVPKPKYEEFELRKSVCLYCDSQAFSGVTYRVSEEEAEIELSLRGNAAGESSGRFLREWENLSQSLKLEFLEKGLKLQGRIVEANRASATVRIKFEQVSLQEHRKLVELLYCRSEQWESRQTPGEWHCLWLLLKLLLRPFVLLSSDRKRILEAAQR